MGPEIVACYIAGVRALGLDVGSRTIGLALSDESQSWATAWETLARAGQAADAREVLDRAASKEVSHCVVGWPLELDGRVGRRAKRVQAFIEVLESLRDEREMALVVELWDERFSTAAAERTLLAADVSRAKRKEKIDAVAAQHILQGWLDAQARRRQDGDVPGAAEEPSQ